jgi:hypothetical protein
MPDFDSFFHSTSWRMRTIVERKQTGRNWPQCTVCHGKSESAIRIAIAFLEKSYGRSKWSGQSKPWSNWCNQIESFILSLPPCPHLAWPPPLKSHLQGGFHTAHSLPLAAGWEQVHPALLPGDWSCAFLVAELRLLKPTFPGAGPASLEPLQGGRSGFCWRLLPLPKLLEPQEWQHLIECEAFC